MTKKVKRQPRRSETSQEQNYGKAVRPELPKFCYFGNFFKFLGISLTVSLVFGFLNVLCFWANFINVNGRMLNKKSSHLVTLTVA